MARTVYERDTDDLFAAALARPGFARLFLELIVPSPAAPVRRVARQTPHASHGGSIDLEIHLGDGKRLLIENKIDAGYSVTNDGVPQPDRYAASVAALWARGVEARSVLLAPRAYLAGSRFAAAFNRTVAYEALRPGLSSAERELLEAAIAQAETPYEPAPNDASADFFAAYAAHAARAWPHLVLKRNPNGNGVRPTESRTIYFDVPRILRAWPGAPRPRMSLQCRDGAAPSASVKIMLGGLGPRASRLTPPRGLTAIGGYLRPAGQSLGCVIDTPRLDTQSSFATQVGKVDMGLRAADRLVGWWNGSGAEILAMVKGAAA